MQLSRFITVSMIAIVLVAVYFVGYKDGKLGEDSQLLAKVQAAESSSATNSGGWTRTKPYPIQEVYYPGTEELGPDEIRVIACGSGMPMPRLKQAAACFLIELGNGDKFIFDVGTGSFTTLYALGMPLDYMTKIFLTHQHADHMGDLPTFWIYGMQKRSFPAA